MNRLHYWLFLVPLVWLSGCSTFLPQAQTESTTFQSFDEARATIGSLVPMKSNVIDLKKAGFDPYATPNTKVLTHSDVVRLLVPSAILRREDLDPGVLVCMEARDSCYGLEIAVSKITRSRTGNFFYDFINFERRTETKGWRFNALILVVRDLVVYRAWGGQPEVSELEVNTNPLGPFQDIGPSLLSTR